MSINWVMIPAEASQTPFTPLPGETTLYASPPRTSFTIATIGQYPASQPFSMTSASGTFYLTSKRVIYLPSKGTPQFQSFAAPLLNLQDSHVSAPWIGPNVWSALVRPVEGGNLPTDKGLEVKVTFKDGGAYEFQSKFEQIRERMIQAVEMARERGRPLGAGEGVEQGRGRGPGVMEGVEVVLEDLPRYEEARQVPGTDATPEAVQEVRSGEVHTNGFGNVSSGGQSRDEAVFTPPDEPPPGYDQVQREAIEDEFSRRLTTRLESGRQETESR